MSKSAAFIRLSRPHFLLGGALMFGLGASFISPVHWGRYAFGQLMVTSAQLTAHYANEYADFEADKRVLNRTAFSGGSGVLTSGELDRDVALRAAQLTSLIAIVTAIFVSFVSVPAAILGLLALTISWAYSVPPVRLLNTGFGELATAIAVAGLVPLTGALLQGDVPGELWWIIVQLVLLQLAMLLTFEIPDADTDALAGKSVLAVRLGRHKTVCLIVGLVIAAAIVSVMSVWAGPVDARLALGAVLALPTAVGLLWTVHGEQYQAMTFCGVATFFLCGCGLLLAQ